MWYHEAACQMEENRCVGKTKYILGEWKTIGREDLSEFRLLFTPIPKLRTYGLTSH
jgi:hypothetical protein